MAASQPVQFTRLADVFSELAWLLRREFAPLFLIAAVAVVPLTLISAMLGTTAPAPSTESASITSIQFWLDAARRLGSRRDTAFPMPLIELILQPLATGALILAITGRYASRAVHARDSIGAASQRLLALVGTELLRILVLVSAAIPTLICILVVSARRMQLIFALEPGSSASGIDVASVVFSGLAALGLALPLYVGLRLSFAPQALLLEHLRPAQSLVYSWDLTRGRFWRVLRVLAVVWLFSLLLVRLPAMLLSEQLLVAVSSNVGIVLATTLDTMTRVITATLATCASTLLYFSLALNQPRPAPAPPNADDPRPILAAIEPPGASS